MPTGFFLRSKASDANIAIIANFVNLLKTRICNIIVAHNCAQCTAKRPWSIEFYTLIFRKKFAGWLFLSTDLHSKEEIDDLKI